MNTTFVKGLIMALVGFVASTISTQNPVNWIYVGIASLAFTILYLAKNWKFPSTSKFLGFNASDFLSGLFIAASMAISTYAADLLTSTVFNLHALLVAVGSAVGGYILKTVLSNSQGKVLSLEGQ